MKKLKTSRILVSMLQLVFLMFFGCDSGERIGFGGGVLLKKVEVAKIDRDRILYNGSLYLKVKPVPITDFTCERSQGGLQDFYSEGDYWWPNPENPDGPYIRRDGETNPSNFTAHRKAMRQMSLMVATLAAAYKITGESQYAEAAIKHLKTWFVNKETHMNPHMRFAQAIKGVVPGRGVGLIDGIHLVEPARAISVLKNLGAMSESDYMAMKKWFSEFLTWMTTHEYGIDERERKNNHGTCWVMQAAEFARLTENEQILNYCRNRFKTVLLQNQVSTDGSFHMELARTKPYGYSLFNIDAIAMVCFILSTGDDNLWTFQLSDDRGVKKAMEFIAPFIKDKSSWPLPPDVMYWDEWPVRHPALLFTGMALDIPEYIELWKTLTPLPGTDEGLRNFPIREPVLWF